MPESVGEMSDTLYIHQAASKQDGTELTAEDSVKLLQALGRTAHDLGFIMGGGASTEHTQAQPHVVVDEYVSPQTADDFCKLMGLRISDGDNITFVPAEQRRLRELLAPQLPQPVQPSRSRLLNDEEIEAHIAVANGDMQLACRLLLQAQVAKCDEQMYQEREVADAATASGVDAAFKVCVAWLRQHESNDRYNLIKQAADELEKQTEAKHGEIWKRANLASASRKASNDNSSTPSQ